MSRSRRKWIIKQIKLRSTLTLFISRAHQASPPLSLPHRNKNFFRTLLVVVVGRLVVVGFVVCCWWVGFCTIILWPNRYHIAITVCGVDNISRNTRSSTKMVPDHTLNSSFAFIVVIVWYFCCCFCCCCWCSTKPIEYPTWDHIHAEA